MSILRKRHDVRNWEVNIMDINKNFPTCVVIRSRKSEGTSSTTGKPYKLHIVTVRWHMNEEQTDEIIPYDMVVARGDILAFEPISGQRRTTWTVVQE